MSEIRPPDIFGRQARAPETYLVRIIRAWLLRLRGSFDKQRSDHDLAAELDSHLQFHIEDHLRAGMTAEEARRQALIKLGGLEQAKESYRHRRAFAWLDSLVQDIRFVLRLLPKNFVFVLTTNRFPCAGNRSQHSGLFYYRCGSPAAASPAATGTSGRSFDARKRSAKRCCI